MTLSLIQYSGIWGTAVLAWLALAYEYYGKWAEELDYLGMDIRSFNAERGYDQSIGREELAQDLRIPYRGEKLREYAKNNGLSVADYESELKENIGNPEYLFWALILHLIGVLYTLAGITYLSPGGILSASTYLVTVYLLLIASLLLYWYL